MLEPVRYLGVDVAKDTLAVSFGRRRWQLANAQAGHQKFITLLRKEPGPIQVVCEATGPYHVRLCLALQGAGLAFSIINPRRIHHYALSEGIEAKNDSLDAALVERFAQAKRPPADPPLNLQQIALREMLSHRHHLIEAAKVLQTHRQQIITSVVGKELDRSLALLEKRIAALEEKLRAMVLADAELKTAFALLTGVQGVGFVTAVTLVARMPELGSLNRGQCAALAGLAPFDDASGSRDGKRSIRGGRADVRTVLYMAALTASRSNPVLQPVYERLLRTGKPFKVAITAIMRKLLLYLNHLLKPLKTAPV
jgi:transposase